MTKNELMLKNRKLEQNLCIKEREVEYYENHARNLKEEVEKKDAEIKSLTAKLNDMRHTIDRLNQQLTEKELFEKKMKEAEERRKGLLTEYYDPRVDDLVKGMCMLEAKIEAKERPYFF